MKRVKQAAIGLATLLLATFAATAATQHDNYVYFALAGVQYFNFAPTAVNITSGQPYGGTTSGVSQAGKQGFILVKAGRKGSTGVAQWFQQQVGAGQTLVCNSTSTFPKELNFAVEGTLTMQVGGKTITCDNIIVAQGAPFKNWWMGGPYMAGAHVGPSGATIQSCWVKDSLLPTEVIFSPATPCNNHFNIGFLRPPSP
jgi:hypothetical protein